MNWLTPDAQLVLALCVFLLIVLVFVLIVLIVNSRRMTCNTRDLFDVFTPLFLERPRSRKTRRKRLT
jgi:hypothetical protein